MLENENENEIPVNEVMYEPSDQRAGASAELPLVVWLSDDDELKSEFVLGVDDVMAELGIKRSRLTQIAGRELRVGRLRIDKYTRPFFRRCDVEAYKKWTRATASHQSSAKIIDKVVAKLDRQFDEMIDSFEDPIDRLQENIKSSIDAGCGAMVAAENQHFLHTIQHLGHLLSDLSGMRAMAEEKASVILAECTRCQSELVALVQKEQVQSELLMETLTEVKQLVAALKTLAAQFTLVPVIEQRQQQLADDVAQMRQGFDQLRTEVNEGWHAIIGQLTTQEQAFAAQFKSSTELFTGMTSGLTREMARMEQTVNAETRELADTCLSNLLDEKKREQDAELARLLLP